MATADEMREWLAGNGYDPPERGRLRQELKDAYAAAHDGGQVPDDPDTGTAAEETPAAPAAETRPQRPRGRARSKTTAGGVISGLITGKKKTAGGTRAKAKARHPRIGLDKFISRLYTRTGQMVSGVSPATGRCLQAQAAMAGVMLEDVARDTIADRMLQPLARAEDKLDKVFALAAPPVLVLMLEAGDPENELRRHMLMGMLRESLLISMDVTEQYSDQIARNMQRSAENEAQIDQLLTFIFQGPEAAAAAAANGQQPQPQPEPAMA